MIKEKPLQPELRRRAKSAIMRPMILPGHLAAGYLAAHYAKLDEKAALMAAIFPDAVDKTGRYILRLTPSGRVPAHALLSMLLATLAVALLFKRRTVVLGWFAGYASHLCMDTLTDIVQWGGGLDYLLWPFRDAVTSRYTTLLGSVQDYVMWVFLLEGLVTAWGAFVWLKSRRNERAKVSMPARVNPSS